MWQGRRVLITGHTGFKGGSIDATLAWHRGWRAGSDMQRFTCSQIAAFEQAAGRQQLLPGSVAAHRERAA